MTLRRCSPLLLGLLLVAGLRAQEARDTSIFLRYLALNGTVEQAGRAVAARRFGEAQRLLEPCLAKVPEHFEAHFLLARMAYEAKDFTGALGHLEVARRSLAELDRLYRDEMAAMKAQVEAEEQAMRASLDNLYSRGADPSGCTAPLFRSKQNALDYYEARKGHLHDRENPFGLPAEYAFLQGNCLYRLGRRSEALDQYRQAVQTDPAHGSAWNNLISLQWEAGAYAQARADLDRAEAARITIRPDLKQAVLAASASGARPLKQDA